MNNIMRWRPWRVAAAAFVCVVGVAACGDDGERADAPPSASGSASGSPAAETTETTETTETAEAGAYPVTIEHSAGSTTIEERPERIVTLNVQWTDAVLAMGEEPVGYVLDEAAGETEPYPWQDGLLDGPKQITTNGTIPFEEIAALEPDLILATFSVTEPSQVETLQQIAPTIPNLTGVVDQWQDHIEVLGRVLGEPDTAEEVIAELDGDIDAMAEELPGLAGKTYVLANYVEGDGIYIVADPDDGAARLFDGLGMEIAPAVLELDGAQVGRVQISTEQVSVLDADFIGILTNGSDPSALPGWDRLRAVRGGALVNFELADIVGLNTPSAVSLPYVMELMRPSLQVVAGA